MSKTLIFIIPLVALLPTVSPAEDTKCDPVNIPDMISCMRTVYELGLKAEILKNLKDIDGVFSKQCVELQNCYPILNCGDVEKREAADKVIGYCDMAKKNLCPSIRGSHVLLLLIMVFSLLQFVLYC